MKTLYLCGAGNSEGTRLALRINEQQHRWDRIVLLDDDPATHGRVILDVPVIGPITQLHEVDPAESEAVNLVARTTTGRMLVAGKIAASGVPFAPLVHPGVDTRGVTLPQDIVVYQNATLGPEVRIEDGTVVFMGAIVGHESHVAGYCVVAANAVLNARVVLEEGVYIGSNASVLPEVRIGAWSTVGAASMVSRDIPAGATVLGVPGKALMLKKASSIPSVQPEATPH